MGHKREWKSKESFEAGAGEHAIKPSRIPSSHPTQAKLYSSHGQAIREQISPVCSLQGEKHLHTWQQPLLPQTTHSQQAAPRGGTGGGKRDHSIRSPGTWGGSTPQRGPAPGGSPISGLTTCHPHPPCRCLLSSPQPETRGCFGEGGGGAEVNSSRDLVSEVHWADLFGQDPCGSGGSLWHKLWRNSFTAVTRKM